MIPPTTKGPDEGAGARGAQLAWPLDRCSMPLVSGFQRPCLVSSVPV